MALSSALHSSSPYMPPLAPLDTPPPERFSPIPPSSLPRIISKRSLILDIRTIILYASSRLPGAIHLSVPSTLLKRPNFSLKNVEDTIAAVADRSKLNSWRGVESIVVYDTDTQILQSKSNLFGLLRKFDAEGFKGVLGFVQGGFSAIWKWDRSILDLHPIAPPTNASSSTGYIPAYTSAPAASSMHARSESLLRASDLPISAFQQGPLPAHLATLSIFNPSMTMTIVASTANASNRPVHSALPINRDGFPAPAPTSSLQIPFNPFYDNIRQNTELSSGITERIPLNLSAYLLSRKDELPYQWLKDIASDETGESLAMQFYRIELGEQRRLMGVMDHHSRESMSAPVTIEHGYGGRAGKQVDPFPFSITAGVEKGDKNRYRDIWPFEHARVRLQTVSELDGSDYVNASYIQPRGTNHRYIATQGPLDSTFDDFWTVVWEQNVHVIVMLTKQVEGSSVKCGEYWTSGTYGPLILKALAVSGGRKSPQPQPPFSGGGGFFGTQGDNSSDEDDSSKPIIRRTFLLSHSGHPHTQPRLITQLQYIGWPDLNVPRSPAKLLSLIKEVEVEREEGYAIGMGPVLVHCSAGVGRTGAFVIVDAVLDGIRREMKSDRLVGRGKGVHVRRSREMSVDMGGSGVGSENFVTPPPPSSMRAHHSHSRGNSVSMASPPASPTKRMEIDREPSHIGQLTHSSLAPSSLPAGLTTSVSVSSSGIGIHRKSVGPVYTNPTAFPHYGPTSPSIPAPSSYIGPSGPVSPSMSVTTPSLASNSFAWNTSSGLGGGRAIGPYTSHTSPTSEYSPSIGASSIKHAGDYHHRSSGPQQPTSFDYASPRQIKPNPTSPMAVRDTNAPAVSLSTTPPSPPSPLSSFSEPIRQILEGMREQRMSLCQSLRQYVFVHRAILEGTLSLVDEERRLGGR